MIYRSLSTRIKKLEHSLHDEYQTIIALDDGTEIDMDIGELFDLMLKWNTLPFKKPAERELTESDWAWMRKLSRARPNPCEVSYCLVVGAKEIAKEYLECGGVPKRRSFDNDI